MLYVPIRRDMYGDLYNTLHSEIRKRCFCVAEFDISDADIVLRHTESQGWFFCAFWGRTATLMD